MRVCMYAQIIFIVLGRPSTYKCAHMKDASDGKIRKNYRFSKRLVALLKREMEVSGRTETKILEMTLMAALGKK